MKRTLRIISVLLVLSLSLTPFAMAAPGFSSISQPCNAAEITGCTKESILSEYHKEIFDLKESTSLRTSANDAASVAQIQANTVTALHDAGYEAYDVNPQTFDTVEGILSTDLQEIGLNPAYSYIVIVEGEENQSVISPASSAKPSFDYTYNGTVYKLRYLTVTAADDPAMGKSSSVDLLKSKSKEVIQNCLDTVISAYISGISNVLGTVASICGLSVSNFDTASESTLTIFAGTNWTRKYTQVWSSYDNAWAYCASVEYVTAFSHMGGLYYSASDNKYVPVPPDESEKTDYSDHFYDADWQNENAVNGYLTGWIEHDLIGDVVYKYGGVTKITHRENF